MDATTEAIRFRVPAIPIAQPRQRTRAFAAKNGKLCAQNYTPQDSPVNSFKATVARSAQDAYGKGPLAGPLHVSLVFVFPRLSTMLWKSKPMPRLWYDKAKNDLDNLAKAALDALKGITWFDDGQIAQMALEKVYAAGDEPAGVEVEIRRLNPIPAPLPLLEAAR